MKFSVINKENSTTLIINILQKKILPGQSETQQLKI